MSSGSLGSRENQQVFMSGSVADWVDAGMVRLAQFQTPGCPGPSLSGQTLLHRKQKVVAWAVSSRSWFMRLSFQGRVSCARAGLHAPRVATRGFEDGTTR